MKLNLDFSLYKGTTRLRVWWKEVKKHFEAVQKAHNDLEDAHAKDKKTLTDADASERTARETADNNLGQRITDEATARQNADTALGVRITNETNARTDADTALGQRITDEAATAKGRDDLLMGYIELLLRASHTHANKDVLDGITAAQVEAWDNQAGIQQNMIFCINNVLNDLYRSMGVVTYDGGWFGMEYESRYVLDGGTFTETEAGKSVDGGDFSQRDVHKPIYDKLSEMDAVLGSLADEIDTVNGII